MKKNKIMLLVVFIVAAAVIIGLKVSKTVKESISSNADSQIAYYTCGMHPSVNVSEQEYNNGNTACPICNMNLVPVYKEKKSEVPDREKKILFYRNPMNPNITSDVPAKDQMGMDYIPVYEASEQQAEKLKGVISKVMIKGDQARLAGVQIEPVKKLHVYKEIRTVGKVAFDPKLAIAQEEFISSLKSLDKINQGNIVEIKQRAENLVKSAKRKLKLLGLSETQIKELEVEREVQTNLILPEKKMWIYGNVYEYELSWLKVGAEVRVTTSSIPGEEFLGVVSSINPVLDPRTRSVIFRAEIDNHDLKLKPEMYVDVVIMSVYAGPEGEYSVLAIPKDAVLDTGARKIVWVNKGNNEYEGREVQIGPEATAKIGEKEDKFYPILSGLTEGEMIVTKSNFLIDSQSQITGVAAAAYGGALGAEEQSDKALVPTGH